MCRRTRSAHGRTSARNRRSRESPGITRKIRNLHARAPLSNVQHHRTGREEPDSPGSDPPQERHPVRGAPPAGPAAARFVQICRKGPIAPERREGIVDIPRFFPRPIPSRNVFVADLDTPPTRTAPGAPPAPPRTRPHPPPRRPGPTGRRPRRKSSMSLPGEKAHLNDSNFLSASSAGNPRARARMLRSRRSASTEAGE